ncbi:alpha/beta hydrolase [Rhodococcus opacus]|uniref:Alpha/beta hydrolase n=1 Tax=Rhodococcus opacus TaxID=37919 RepID=A0AAX3YQ18_RHOOP|nr:alpha/beta hydrolase [Rhodococcus opacus]MCZ4587588.1 alpha/beta hydrolase [Rhodococcus opacus]WLF51411.1 alpha/beta hydrolase [Rhodococcus opacus]
MFDTAWVALLGAEIRTVGNRYRGRCLVAGDGPPLILLHGQGGHLENFSRNVTELAQTHTVYAPDCVWHGLGPQPPFEPALIPTYVDQVLDLIESERLPRVSVLGQSMGGWTAARLAVDYESLVDRLILVNPQGIHLRARSTEPEILPAPGPAVRAKHLPALTDPSVATMRDRVLGLVADPTRIDDEVIQIRLNLYRRPEVNASLQRVMEAYMGGSSAPVYDHRVTEQQLHSISQRTLLIWGEKNMISPQAGRRISELIPQSELHVIADTGHWAHYEAPDEHNKIVAQFLAS